MPRFKLFGRGKVRDIYAVGDQLLIVATDRISAFDFILGSGIPQKGKVLTQISLFWFEMMKDIIPNHLISASPREYPAELSEYASLLEGRSMLVKKASPFPVECVARGYLSGSGWKEYQQKGSVCGIALPKGLVESSQLPEPIFTPATKASSGHDVKSVLRLGVGAAEAFEFSIGDQGLGFGAEAPVRSTPVHAILGNFLHLDDGDFVASGAFVSTRRTLEETQRLLEEDAAKTRPYKGVLLTFAGGLTGLRDATDHVARWKRLVRDAGWYPFTVLWCVDYVEQGAGRPRRRLRRGGQARRRPRPPPRPRGRGAAPTASAAPSGATSAAPPSAPRARTGRCTTSPAPAPASRRSAPASACASSPSPRAPSRSPRSSAPCGPSPSPPRPAPSSRCSRASTSSRRPSTRREFADLADDLDAGWTAARPDRRLVVHLPDARDEKRLAVPPYGLS